MKKYRMKATNSIAPAKWFKVEMKHQTNTTNASISPAMFKRECEEYDNGTLPFEHDLYMGERV